MQVWHQHTTTHIFSPLLSLCTQEHPRIISKHFLWDPAPKSFIRSLHLGYTKPEDHWIYRDFIHCSNQDSERQSLYIHLMAIRSIVDLIFVDQIENKLIGWSSLTLEASPYVLYSDWWWFSPWLAVFEFQPVTVLVVSHGGAIWRAALHSPILNVH